MFKKHQYQVQLNSLIYPLPEKLTEINDLHLFKLICLFSGGSQTVLKTTSYQSPEYFDADLRDACNKASFILTLNQFTQEKIPTKRALANYVLLLGLWELAEAGHSLQFTPGKQPILNELKNIHLRQDSKDLIKLFDRSRSLEVGNQIGELIQEKVQSHFKSHLSLFKKWKSIFIGDLKKILPQLILEDPT